MIDEKMVFTSLTEWCVSRSFLSPLPDLTPLSLQ